MVAFRETTYRTRVGGGRETGTRSEVYLSEWYNLIKTLREVDKELLKQFRKDARKITKPVQQDIRDNIPSNPPIRGMARRIEPGRLTWGTRKPAKSALIKVSNPRKFERDGRTAIAAVRVKSPATIVADMAGKSNRITGRKKVTERYAYSRAKSGFRTHRLNGQGEIMIRALNVKSSASRFVWPGALKALPEARAEFQAAVSTVVRKINAELERVDGQ